MASTSIDDELSRVTRAVAIGPRGQAVMLVLSAVLMGLSYPRPNLWLLAYVALVPMSLAALRAGEGIVLAGISFVVGWAWWLVMIRWMIPVTLPGYIMLSAYMGAYWTAYLATLRMVHRRYPMMAVWSVPILWVGFEYLRGILLTGFPWFELGHSQPTHMIQIADFAGSYGVSFVVAMCSGAIVDLLTRPLVHPRTRRFGMPVRLSLPAAAIAIIFSFAYGSYRMGQSVDDASIRVAVVQSNVPQSNKEQPSDEQDLADFRQMIKLSDQAATDKDKPDLIAWPETMVPRAINSESVALFRKLNPPLAEYHDALIDFAKQHHIAMLVGAHAMVGWPDFSPARRLYLPAQRFNATYLISPAGVIEDRYDKIHRVPFGEYIPWVESISTLRDLLLKLTPYSSDYTLNAGTKYIRFKVKVPAGGASAGGAAGAGERTWRFASPICFEDVVSDVPRHMVWDGGDKRIDLLVSVSNDGWFAGTAEPIQHEQIARFRCVENRVPMARSVNRGVSGFLDSCGRIVQQVTADGRMENVAAEGAASLHRDGRATMFGLVGDLFALACLVFTAVLILGPFAVKLINRKRATSS